MNVEVPGLIPRNLLLLLMFEAPPPTAVPIPQLSHTAGPVLAQWLRSQSLYAPAADPDHSLSHSKRPGTLLSPFQTPTSPWVFWDLELRLKKHPRTIASGRVSHSQPGESEGSGFRVVPLQGSLSAAA